MHATKHSSILGSASESSKKNLLVPLFADRRHKESGSSFSTQNTTKNSTLGLISSSIHNTPEKSVKTTSKLVTTPLKFSSLTISEQMNIQSCYQSKVRSRSALRTRAKSPSKNSVVYESGNMRRESTHNCSMDYSVNYSRMQEPERKDSKSSNMFEESSHSGSQRVSVTKLINQSALRYNILSRRESGNSLNNTRTDIDPKHSMEQNKDEKSSSLNKSTVRIDAQQQRSKALNSSFGKTELNDYLENCYITEPKEPHIFSKDPRVTDYRAELKKRLQYSPPPHQIDSDRKSSPQILKAYNPFLTPTKEVQTTSQSSEPTPTTQKSPGRSFRDARIGMIKSVADVQRLISASTALKGIQKDENLSKIKWKNPYQEELQTLQRPSVDAAIKIQKMYRAKQLQNKLKHYRWGIRRVQRWFKGFLVKTQIKQSILKDYLLQEERAYYRARADESRSLEADHKLLLENEDILRSIDKYYNSILSEREEFYPYKGTPPPQGHRQTQHVDSASPEPQNNFKTADLEFFTRVIDIDALVDTKQITDKLWIDQYYHVTENLSAEAPIHTIEVGETFSLVVNSKNKVFAWGLDQHHLLGVHSSQVQGTVKQIQQEMGSAKLKVIVVSDDHTLALDYNSDVYTWGDNDKGKLGIGFDDEIPYPIKMRTLPKGQIESIAAKGNINIALTRNGEVIMWPIFKNFDANTLSGSSNIPMQLAMPCGPVSKVACGYNFALLIGSNGLTYALGDNQYGQLGLGDCKNREKPELVEWLKNKGEKCAAVSCGFKHVVFLSGLGRVYTWGSGHFGQLGHGDYKDSSLPVLLHSQLEEYGVKISQVQAGMRASCALTEDYRLLWWGNNGMLTKQSTPLEAKLFEMFPDNVNYLDKIPAKICCKWSKTISVTYITIGKFNRPDPNTLHLKRKTLFALGKRWEDHHIDPPQMCGLDKNFKTDSSKKITLLNMKRWNEGQPALLSSTMEAKTTRSASNPKVNARYSSPSQAAERIVTKARSEKSSTPGTHRAVPPLYESQQTPVDNPYDDKCYNDNGGCAHHHAYE